LQQVLLNLSLNAVDAMPKGGTLTIAATQESPNRLTITVADTGIGIEPDVLPRIFQPFFTSKKRRGLGLGLPICDRIVKGPWRPDRGREYARRRHEIYDSPPYQWIQ
jgi:two-component system sensor histidine kinase HydH